MNPANTFVGVLERMIAVYAIVGGLFVIIAPYLRGLGVI